MICKLLKKTCKIKYKEKYKLDKLINNITYNKFKHKPIKLTN